MTAGPVRMHLGDLGVLRLAISEVHVASGQSTITLRYRGSTLETHLEAGLRLECVATDGQARSCRSVATHSSLSPASRWVSSVLPR